MYDINTAKTNRIAHSEIEKCIDYSPIIIQLGVAN